MGKTAKNVDFRLINRYICETIEDMHIQCSYKGRLIGNRIGLFEKKKIKHAVVLHPTFITAFAFRHYTRDK